MRPVTDFTNLPKITKILIENKVVPHHAELMHLSFIIFQNFEEILGWDIDDLGEFCSFCRIIISAISGKLPLANKNFLIVSAEQSFLD